MWRDPDYIDRVSNYPPLQDRHAWKSGLWAMQDTLVLERFVNNELLNIHRDADSDPHVSTAKSRTIKIYHECAGDRQIHP